MKVLLLGSKGTLGRSFALNLRKQPDVRLFELNREDLDFKQTGKLIQILDTIKPSFILNCVGKVGGVKSNIEDAYELIVENAATTLSIANATLESGVKNYIYFAPACVYPHNLVLPASVEDLWMGSPEVTSRPYASSKLMGIELCRTANQKFGTSWRVYIPTNLFGPGDWSHKEKGHAISMISKRIFEAIESDNNLVTLWGSGEAKRDFLLTDDFASLVVDDFSKNANFHLVTNVPGYGSISIRDLAVLISEIAGYKGKITFDSSMPEGAKNKHLAWNSRIDLPLFRNDLKSALEIYLSQMKQALF